MYRGIDVVNSREVKANEEQMNKALARWTKLIGPHIFFLNLKNRKDPAKEITNLAGYEYSKQENTSN